MVFLSRNFNTEAVLKSDNENFVKNKSTSKLIDSFFLHEYYWHAVIFCYSLYAILWLFVSLEFWPVHFFIWEIKSLLCTLLEFLLISHSALRLHDLFVDYLVGREKPTKATYYLGREVAMYIAWMALIL